MLSLGFEGVGKFQGNIPLIEGGQMGNLPFQPGISSFIKYNIQIGTLFRIVTKAKVGQDLRYGRVVLNEG